jgi:hypothetical protein
MPEKEQQPSGVDLPTVEHDLGDGHTLLLAMTNDVDLFDTLSKRAGEIPPNELRLLYSDKAAWLSTNPSQDRHVGYVCANCHEPVVHIEVRSKEKKIIHHRQSCGCSVIFIGRAAMFWWFRQDSAKNWNSIISWAKETHRAAGIS